MEFVLYLLVWAFAYSTPVLLLVWLVRRRITPAISGVVSGMAFAAATAFTLYRIEWFDMWRHGVPSARYLSGYLPWIGSYALVGWFTGFMVGRSRQTPL